MKLVYLAEDLRPRRAACALAEMVDSFTVRTRRNRRSPAFQREADMLAQLSNEHIPAGFRPLQRGQPSLFGDGVYRRRHARGRTQVQRRPTQARTRIEIAIQVLDTLEYLTIFRRR